MSVFRFEATPATSKPVLKKMKKKSTDNRGPIFAFSPSPSLLQDITLDKTWQCQVSLGTRLPFFRGQYLQMDERSYGCFLGLILKLTFQLPNIINLLRVQKQFASYRMNMDFRISDNSVDVEDTCDSLSDTTKPDYIEGNDSQLESESDSQMEYAEVGIRTTASSGLTMKEYEEQLKKLMAENFNLKLKVYFVEERLSKITGISDKEDLIKKNIQLKVTCESQLKELEKKQELLFEASKAFELLQKEHAEEIEKLSSDKEKEISELEEKLASLESMHTELKSRFPKLDSLNALDSELKSIEEYEKRINDLESNLLEEEDKFKDLENLLKDTQIELESYQLKSQRLESELEQRVRRIDELVDELEQKERDLASANFRIRKLEDEIKSKQREDEIMKERIEEKNKTIDSLKNSLSTRDESIEVLENRLAKERSSSQTLQSKIDGLSFQNSRLKEELEILQSRLRRTSEALSPRGKSRQGMDDELKQKYEDAIRHMDEQEAKHAKQIKELNDQLYEKDAKVEEYNELFEKYKKLEDDHKKACTALKNFIKRSSDDKKEREALNHMLNSHEEIISDLKLQLDHYRNKSLSQMDQEKLSLAGTGDNDRKFGWSDADKGNCCFENDSEKKVVLEQVEGKETSLKECESDTVNYTGEVKENMDKVSKLEAEVLVLKNEIDNRSNLDSEGQDLAKQFLLNELETKKCEIEKLNGELRKEKLNTEEVVNNELWDKNRQIEESKFSEVSQNPWVKDEKLKIADLLELMSKTCENKENDSSLCECLQAECAMAEKVRKEAAEICSLLFVRLEELAEFLDSLLADSQLLSGLDLKKLQDIKQAMQKSRELSQRLSLSLINKNNSSETSFLWSNSFSVICKDSFGQNDSLGNFLSRDKVISEQTIIINKLRDQLKLLNQEIKQRDIELSHCQEDHILQFSDDKNNMSDQGIEGQSLSICQEISDDDNDNYEAAEDEKKEQSFDKSSIKFMSDKKNPTQETSESEAWSEPDRSVSLARMGRLEDVLLNSSHRNSKCDYSSESSEETLNENPRNSGKRVRSSEIEIRRLQSKIKALDELNENLSLELNIIKSEKAGTNLSSKLISNNETNLMEKLRKTMDRLDECSLTCRQLEEKLAGALERASSSAMQLSKAQETISNLEEEISQLKDEITVKTLEAIESSQGIKELEKKMEKMAIESELKISEAIKQKEAAERKTLEVECRLKDAENMSKEVESRVNEIEKKISETKKFKKETVMHFKEAEKHVDTAEKMMEEAERIKSEAEKKSKDFQNFIDLMRKEVEEKLKEAERKVKKSEKEKEELEKQVIKLKKRLMEAEKNKAEVEAKVKEGKETIQCMEEKLKELEVAMDQCSEEAQRKIREIQKKAEVRVTELEMKMEEREWVRKTEMEKKMLEAEKLSRELEVGFRRQLEEAEKRVKRAKESSEAAIKAVKEEAEKQETELRRKIADLEAEKKEECATLRRQLDEVKLEASELELELTKLTNEKIHLEEELKRMLDKESALIKDNKEIKGKYESSIHDLENKLTQLAKNKTHLATRLEEIESTNIDLVSRISAIRGKETMTVEHEFTALSPPYSPPDCESLVPNLFGDFDYGAELKGGKHFVRQSASLSHPEEQVPGLNLMEVFGVPRRNMNSSPDLGIESDPGRFSSLEANQQMHGDQPGVLGSSDLPEIKKLECENAELKRRLVRTRQALEETLTQLSAANQRKKQVERAICKQLHKTHHILKKARVNFESQDGNSGE